MPCSDIPNLGIMTRQQSLRQFSQSSGLVRRAAERVAGSSIIKPKKELGNASTIADA
jgi:hypothetical protein